MALKLDEQQFLGLFRLALSFGWTIAIILSVVFGPLRRSEFYRKDQSTSSLKADFADQACDMTQVLGLRIAEYNG